MRSKQKLRSKKKSDCANRAAIREVPKRDDGICLNSTCDNQESQMTETTNPNSNISNKTTELQRDGEVCEKNFDEYGRTYIDD